MEGKTKWCVCGGGGINHNHHSTMMIRLYCLVFRLGHSWRHHMHTPNWLPIRKKVVNLRFPFRAKKLTTTISSSSSSSSEPFNWRVLLARCTECSKSHETGVAIKVTAKKVMVRNETGEPQTTRMKSQVPLGWSIINHVAAAFPCSSESNNASALPTPLMTSAVVPLTTCSANFLASQEFKNYSTHELKLSKNFF